MRIERSATSRAANPARLIRFPSRSRSDSVEKSTYMQPPDVSLSRAFLIKAAEGPLLQTESNHSSEQVLAQGCRRASSERRPPAPAKRIKCKRRDSPDLGLDRGRVPSLAHGYALGW